MRRLLLGCLAVLLITGTMCLSTATAQQESTRFNPGGQSPTAAADDSPAPVFAFFVAISSTILILFTLLKPTRRQL